MRKRHFTKQVGLVLTEGMYKQLFEQTNREEVSISEWIRQAIQEKLCSTKGKGPGSEPDTDFSNVNF